MARIGKEDEVDALQLETAKRTTKEKEVDYMADAPPARPYSEAVSDEHRALLAEHGIAIPE